MLKINKLNYNLRILIGYSTCIIITIVFGLLSRSAFLSPPEFVILYVGDSIWALMVFWVVCLLKPHWHFKKQFFAALLFSYFIEITQLYQATWINQLRHTTIGALILGFGFKFSDLIAYAIGITVGVLLNQQFVRKYLKSQAN